MKPLEYRTYAAKIELRERAEDPAGSPKVIAGYAARFNEPSQDLGGWTEILAPGCFANTLKTDDIRAFFNHDYNFLLARTKSGTLRLWEDETGLAFEIDIPNTSQGNDVYELVKRGDMGGVSFGCYPKVEEWSEDGKTLTMSEAELIEVSPVVFPAFLTPHVEARSLDRKIASRPKPRFPRLERARSIIRLDDEN